MVSKLDHPAKGCTCPAHEERRAYDRDYSRKRYGRLPGPALLEVVLIEQAIARGETTSRIMRTQAVDYETVQKVRAQLDAAVA